MESYIGIKRIEAEPQVKDGKDGYKVVYEDGYTSWSPKETFEKAYHKNNEMSFSEALYAARKYGAKISRKGWNGKGQFVTVATQVEYDDPNGHGKVDHKTSHSAALVFHGTFGDQVGWLASQSDMLSDDWGIVD